MDKLPRMPMLFFDIKAASSNQPDFASCLSRFIGKHYQENPASYAREINELSQLRTAALRAPRDISGCNLLKQYYAQLTNIKNRFKMANETVDIKFVWIDLFNDRETSGDIDFELACIMYNIGSLHVELGARDPRNSDSSMKMACTHFQCAAWAFEQIKNDPLQSPSKDLSHDVMTFLFQVSLAQAQECILEKSINDKRKSTIIAKVASQVMEYYNTALLGLLAGEYAESKTAVAEVVNPKLFKEWKRFVEVKISYYAAITNLYMGISCEDNPDPLALEAKGGERVAWLIAAEERIKEAIKQGESMERPDPMVKECMTTMKEVIDKNLKSAKNDNDHIYHKPILSSDQLTAVKGASLVKPISFSTTDSEIAGRDIFGRLIPIEAHELASVYSEKKDQILRNVKATIESKNEELVSFMSSLNLDTDTVLGKKNPIIPDELIEICAAMSIKKDAVDTLKKGMEQLELLSKESNGVLDEIRLQLVEEATAQAKFNMMAISRKNVSTSHSKMMETFEKELEKLEERYNKTVESDQSLKKTYECILPDVELLTKSSDGASLCSILPSADIPVSEENIGRLKLLLSKVDEMKNQRLMLERQLETAIRTDDVASKVISYPKDEVEQLFEREIKKFDKQIELLNQNISAQENIMNALMAANAEFVPTRKAKMDIESKRRERIDQLVGAYKEYQNFLSHIERGVYFYRRFVESARGLNTRITTFITSQQAHRKPPVQPTVPSTASKPIHRPISSPQFPPAPPPQTQTYTGYNPATYAPTSAPNTYSQPYTPASYSVPGVPPTQYNVPQNYSGQYNVPYSSGQYNNGHYNNGQYNSGQYNQNSQYNNGQYNYGPAIPNSNMNPYNQNVNQFSPQSVIQSPGHVTGTRALANLMDEPIPSITDNVLEPTNKTDAGK